MHHATGRKHPLIPFLCIAFVGVRALSDAEPLDPVAEEAVRSAVAERERAIVEKDRDLFMSLLAPGDEEFLLEQSRWFDYRLSAALADFSLRVEAAESSVPGELRATLRQSYLIGHERERRDVRYIEVYRQVDGAWKDADLAFDRIETAHFSVRSAIPPGEAAAELASRLARSEKAAQDAESAWAVVARSWGSESVGRATVKLFVDRELLRQNSKITIGRLFNGWGEPGESIKLYLRPEASRSYVSVIAHELMHKTTLSNARNQCSWFAEGLANHYGSFAAMGGSYLDGGFHKAADYDRSISWLESRDPELIDNDEEWWIYGGMAGTVLRFIEESWGKEAPHALLRALAAMSQPEAGYVYALHDALYASQLHEAYQRELGVDAAEFDRLWRVWIQGKKK